MTAIESCFQPLIILCLFKNLSSHQHHFTLPCFHHFENQELPYKDSPVTGHRTSPSVSKAAILKSENPARLLSSVLSVPWKSVTAGSQLNLAHNTEELTIRLLALLPRPSYRALKLSAGEAHLLLRNQRHRHAAPALPWTRRPAPHTPEEPGGQSSAAAATTATG